MSHTKKIRKITEKLVKIPTEKLFAMKSVQQVTSAFKLNENYSENSEITFKLDQIKNLFSHKLISFKPNKKNFICVFLSLLALFFYFELQTTKGFTKLWLNSYNNNLNDIKSIECTIEQSNLAMELFRPPSSCDFCANISKADRITNISIQEFEQKYAYSGRPVLISDGMQNWAAKDNFSFDFFKNIYAVESRSLSHEHDTCLFFPYSTEFHSLAEVLNMTTERFKRHWYIGWSNCDAEASHILRQHYSRPYFLPATAESTHADWIFMGTPGHGAHMHIDHVFLPSWQAQVKGSKRWFLQPPPECIFQCASITIDVNPGDIILLDTNKWYHQTQILEGNLSIPIGSEYD